ncbi:hypothetical protein Npun_F4873 [Nostoc punctiforme PCC 73102]|uniref:HicB-like antitoxin of toxin-antitoxin system domain-containing protein n=1 Tax=Nostoc punctiforme (strain ATCC 29133 / PCC 73102) TaxID=63737 RepID=B2J067_NOSP7|nr:hypothetical protein Npun_F4873 [Nostoc punctiforme PCC 73102]
MIKRTICIADCPKVGTIQQRDTIEQVIAGLREATQLYFKESST